MHAALCLYNTCVVRIHSNKCHLQDNIYNTVIYCNNWGFKFHKKRNKAALPFITDTNQSETERIPILKLPIPHLLMWGMDQPVLLWCIPRGVSVFHESRPVLPGAVCVGNFGRKECIWCWVSACLCVRQHLRCTKGWKVFVSVWDLFVSFVGCVSLCVLCLCVSVRGCVSVCLRVCVNVSDRCVGFGLQSCWRCGRAPPSLVGRSCLLRSRSAGKAPGRGCLFCGGAYTPGPLSARACRCETRSAWRSRDPQNSPRISGKCLPPCLEKTEGTD